MINEIPDVKTLQQYMYGHRRQGMAITIAEAAKNQQTQIDVPPIWLDSELWEELEAKGYRVDNNTSADGNKYVRIKWESGVGPTNQISDRGSSDNEDTVSAGREGIPESKSGTDQEGRENSQVTQLVAIPPVEEGSKD